MRDTNGFRELSLGLWTELINGLFPDGIPSSARWTDLNSMVSVLNFVGSKDHGNHMFYPTGGGNDLKGAFVYEEEPGCLALKMGNRVAEVVKPSALLFESFGPELEWAYFRLECEPLAPCGVYDYEDDEDGGNGEDAADSAVPSNEEVVLVRPGTYGTRSDWDENEYQGKRLPETAQLIVRSLGGGPYVVFSKGSSYNLVRGDSRTDAYSARHAKMSAEEFRQLLERSARR